MGVYPDCCEFRVRPSGADLAEEAQYLVRKINFKLMIYTLRQVREKIISCCSHKGILQTQNHIQSVDF